MDAQLSVIPVVLMGEDKCYSSWLPTDGGDSKGWDWRTKEQPHGAGVLRSGHHPRSPLSGSTFCLHISYTGHSKFILYYTEIFQQWVTTFTNSKPRKN